jgi:hypothetical protein
MFLQGLPVILGSLGILLLELIFPIQVFRVELGTSGLKFQKHPNRILLLRW